MTLCQSFICVFVDTPVVLDGAWSSWSNWAQCTSCKDPTSTTYRKRTCDNPPPTGGGAECSPSDNSREQVQELNFGKIYMVDSKVKYLPYLEIQNIHFCGYCRPLGVDKLVKPNPRLYFSIYMYRVDKIRSASRQQSELLLSALLF